MGVQPRGRMSCSIHNAAKIRKSVDERARGPHGRLPVFAGSIYPESWCHAPVVINTNPKRRRGPVLCRVPHWRFGLVLFARRQTVSGIENRKTWPAANGPRHVLPGDGSDFPAHDASYPRADHLAAGQSGIARTSHCVVAYPLSATSAGRVCSSKDASCCMAEIARGFVGSSDSEAFKDSDAVEESSRSS